MKEEWEDKDIIEDSDRNSDLYSASNFNRESYLNFKDRALFTN